MKFSYKRNAGIAIYFILLSLCSSSQTYKRICVIDSSSTWGYFPNTSIPRDSGWALKVKRYYKNLGLIDTLYNIEVVGNDCYNGMPTSFNPLPTEDRLTQLVI